MRDPAPDRHGVLHRAFRAAFERTAITFIRAPGRVNLIGEHTDYNGYPVLPVAIDRDIAVAGAPSTDGLIRVVNTDPRYAPRVLDPHAPGSTLAHGDWGRYVDAAARGLAEHGLLAPGGACLCVDGAVPAGAGLASSSALVVATALALLATHGIEHDPASLAVLLARAERHAGAEGGGMDQAASLLARAGHALKIDFFPLRVDPVPLPDGCRIVVSHSLIDAGKTRGARDAYNTRVAECRLAALLLSHGLRGDLGADIDSARLADLSPDALHAEPDIVEHTAARMFAGSPLHLDEISRRTGMPIGTLTARACTASDGRVIPPPAQGFDVQARYRHVVGEAARVARAAATLRAGDLDAFGLLMNASHASCRDDYGVSCRELDVLVDICRSHGAIGARLTGAGFGGCTVSIVPEGRARQFAKDVFREYHQRWVPRHRPDLAALAPRIDDVVIIAESAPAAGPLPGAIA